MIRNFEFFSSYCGLILLKFYVDIVHIFKTVCVGLDCDSLKDNTDISVVFRVAIAIVYINKILMVSLECKYVR